ncbi:MAG: pitrilysin family protein [Verrucomicrobiota bacterium]
MGIAEQDTVPVVEVNRPGVGVVSLQIWIGAGSCAEKDGWVGSGLAHFLEHMVFKGTESRSAAMINRQAELLGGYLNAYTSYDRTVYHIELPAENAVEGLDLLADFVWHPALSDHGFESEREVILREIAMTRDDPENHLFEEMMRAAFPSDTCRYPVIGLEPSFLNLDLHALRSFHRENYFSGECFLLLAGDISEELRLRAKFLVPRKNKSLRDPARWSGEQGAAQVRLTGSWEGSRGSLIFPLKIDTPRTALQAEVLLESLVGGESSLLNRVLRLENSLVHQVDGFIFPVGGCSVLVLSWTADRENLGKVEKTILAEFEQIARGDSIDDWFTDGRDRLAFRMMSRIESIDGLAEWIGDGYRLFGEVLDSSVEMEELRSLKQEDFRNFVGGVVNTAKAVVGQLSSADR